MNSLAKKIDSNTLEKIIQIGRVVNITILPDTITEEEIMTILSIDLTSIQSSFTLSSTSTRRTEQQYCTNSYVAGCAIDTSELKAELHIIYKNAANAAEAANKYFLAKDRFLSLLKVKLAASEGLLRDTLREFETKDGIPGQGRYK